PAQAAECVDGPLVELDAADREPCLATVEVYGDGLRRDVRGSRRRGDRDELRELAPVREHVRHGRADDAIRGEPCDLGGGFVPELDGSLAVDHEDAVPNALEDPGVAFESELLARGLAVEAAHLDRALQ